MHVAMFADQKQHEKKKQKERKESVNGNWCLGLDIQVKDSLNHLARKSILYSKCNKLKRVFHRLNEKLAIAISHECELN